MAEPSPSDELDRAVEAAKRADTERQPSFRVGREKPIPVEVERPMVGCGVRLQARMSSMQRYLVLPLGPDDTVVGVVVRYEEGVVQRKVEARPI